MVSHVCSIYIPAFLASTLKMGAAGSSESFVMATLNIIGLTGCTVSFRPLTTETGFDPGLVYMGFVVDKVALGQALLPVLPFSPVSIISPILRIHSSVSDAM
jgi:hypothetical protein